VSTITTNKWGKYEMEPIPIGQGKQGQVFKGFDPIQKKKVAIKVTKNIESSQYEAFVMQEYGSHKFLAQYYDFFVLNQKAYLVMEWIQGDSLKNKSKIYDEKTAVQITLNLLDGLKHLHNKGYLHADILPNNIMMVKSKVNTVKLIDLGIAVRKGSNNLYEGKHYRKRDTIFCPPEQRLSKRWVLDDSSDLYRIAGICVSLLTKKKPLLNRDTRSHICSLKNEKLERAINKAMHPNREKRYQNAADMMKALERFSRRPK
jgi:serine/threonine protein kinase